MCLQKGETILHTRSPLPVNHNKDEPSFFLCRFRCSIAMEMTATNKAKAAKTRSRLLGYSDKRSRHNARHCWLPLVVPLWLSTVVSLCAVSFYSLRSIVDTVSHPALDASNAIMPRSNTRSLLSETTHQSPETRLREDGTSLDAQTTSVAVTLWNDTHVPCSIVSSLSNMQYLGGGHDGHAFSVPLQCHKGGPTEPVVLKIAVERSSVNSTINTTTKGRTVLRYVSTHHEDRKRRLYHRLVHVSDKHPREGSNADTSFSSVSAMDALVKDHFAIPMGHVDLSPSQLVPFCQLAQKARPNDIIMDPSSTNMANGSKEPSISLRADILPYASGHRLHTALRRTPGKRRTTMHTTVLQNLISIYHFLYQRGVAQCDQSYWHIYQHGSRTTFVDMERHAILDDLKNKKYRLVVEREILWQLLAFVGNTCLHSASRRASSFDKNKFSIPNNACRDRHTNATALRASLETALTHCPCPQPFDGAMTP